MSTPSSRDLLLRHRVRRFVRVLRAVEQGDVRALHRTRVASRRLRELVPVLELDPGTARKLGRRFRAVTVELGRVRELDVLALLVDELHESGRFAAALDLVGADIAAERRAARDRLHATLSAADLRKLAARLEAAADAAPSGGRARRAWRWAIDARIARRAATLATAIHAAGAMYLPERLHAVRIALKKFRYALELAVEADGAKTTPDLVALKRVQDVLGRLHDVQLLIERARRIDSSLPSRDGAAALGQFVAALEDECRRLHAIYVSQRATLLDVVARTGATAKADRQRLVRAPRRAAG